MENDNRIVIEQNESIKISKGMKNNYSWEIKTLDMNIDRLKEIDTQLREQFLKGGNEEDD